MAWLVFLALLGFIAQESEAIPAKRVALVIGNDAYRYGGKLNHAVSDAQQVGHALDALGFQVISKQNLGYTGLLDALDQLGKAAIGADWVLVYYAGHGIQVQGKNHLIPVDVKLNRVGDLRRTVLLDDVLTEVNQARELGLVVLDACRDNPFAARLNQGTGRSLAGRGLARVGETGGNTLVAFATQEDDIAADTGVYATVLAKYLATPDLDVRRLFGKVRDEVMAQTHNSQQPFTYGSLGGGYYVFKSGGDDDGGDDSKFELAFWNSVKDSHNPADLRAYLERYPHGVFVRLAQNRLAGPQPQPQPQPQSPKFGQVFYDKLKDGTQGPAMLRIKGGCFQMGSPESEIGRDNDERQHRVCVNDFVIGQYEVTFAEYDRFCEVTRREKPKDQGWGRGQRPVIYVSWQDAVAYAEWLSYQTGQSYRLPTEAEWEYAARAGTSTAYWWGNQASHRYANYGKDECCEGLAEGKDRWEYTAPVGSFAANPWSLYDTAGNVWEWTCSAYEKSYDGSEGRCANNNHVGYVVLRGGSWIFNPVWVRPANRDRSSPTYRNKDAGVRLVRSS